MNNLKITTYNCKHFDGTIKEKFCSELLEECDFLLLQEHWLYLDNFHKFDNISNSSPICKSGKSSMDPTILRAGRPYYMGAVLFYGKVI